MVSNLVVEVNAKEPVDGKVARSERREREREINKDKPQRHIN